MRCSTQKNAIKTSVGLARVKNCGSGSEAKVFLNLLCVTTVDRAQHRHRGLDRCELRQRGDEGRRRQPNRFKHPCCTALAVRQGGRPWIGSFYASPPPKVSQTPIRTHELSSQRPKVLSLRNEEKRRVLYFIPPQEFLTER